MGQCHRLRCTCRKFLCWCQLGQSFTASCIREVFFFVCNVPDQSLERFIAFGCWVYVFCSFFQVWREVFPLGSPVIESRLSLSVGDMVDDRGKMHSDGSVLILRCGILYWLLKFLVVSRWHKGQISVIAFTPVSTKRDGLSYALFISTGFLSKAHYSTN